MTRDANWDWEAQHEPFSVPGQIAMAQACRVSCLYGLCMITVILGLILSFWLLPVGLGLVVIGVGGFIYYFIRTKLQLRELE